MCAHSRSGGGHNPKVLQTNWKSFKTCDRHGRTLEVLTLPMPTPIPLPEEEGVLPASYANFYIGNSAVLLPVFKDHNDAKAVEMLGEAFPDREIVPIDARDLVYGYGSFHCVTQQEPSVKS